MNFQTLSACPVCAEFFKEGSYRTISYPTIREKLLDNIPRAINLCANCGAGVAIPGWSNYSLEKFYSGGNFWKNSDKGTILPKKHPTAYALAMSRWKIIEPLFVGTENSVSMLDVGAGYGLLGMIAAKSKKVRLAKYTCIEKDASVAQVLKETWLNNFPRINFEVKDSIEHIDEEFNAVIFSHVLEHQNNPRTMLEMALGKVVAEGLVFIEVPNQDYLFKRDVFPHLIFFTALSLQLLAKDCGLTVKLLNGYGHPMKRSPLNYRNTNGLSATLLKMITAMSKVVPSYLWVSFFSRYWGLNAENDDGTWIRAVFEKNTLVGSE